MLISTTQHAALKIDLSMYGVNLCRINSGQQSSSNFPWYHFSTENGLVWVDSYPDGISWNACLSLAISSSISGHWL